jgi:hypothetical protein
LRLVARVATASGAREGGERGLTLDPGELHLFDADSGIRVLGPGARRNGR